MNPLNHVEQLLFRALSYIERAKNDELREKLKQRLFSKSGAL